MALNKPKVLTTVCMYVYMCIYIYIYIYMKEGGRDRGGGETIGTGGLEGLTQQYS